MGVERKQKTIRHTHKAGQHAKQQSFKHFYHGLHVLFFLTLAGALVAGVSLGVLLERVSWDWKGIVTLAVALLIAVLLQWPMNRLIAWAGRPLDRHLDLTARERVRWMRGGQAEALVSWLLTDLGPDYHLFDNLSLGEGAEDIDHILIGPTGLFAVSTKGHRGTLRVGPDGAVTMNGRPRPWARDVTRQLMRLRNQLEVVTRTKLPWVQAVLAAPQAHIETPGPPAKPGRAAPGGVWFLHQDDLTVALTERKPVLDRKTVEELARAMTELQTRHSAGAPAAPVASPPAPDDEEGEEHVAR